MPDREIDTVWPPPPRASTEESTVSDERHDYDEFLDKHFAELPESERRSCLPLVYSLRKQYGLRLRYCVNIVNDWQFRRGHPFPVVETREKVVVGLGCFSILCFFIVEALFLFVHDYSPVNHVQRLVFHKLRLDSDLAQIGVSLLLIVFASARLIEMKRRRAKAGVASKSSGLN